MGPRIYPSYQDTNTTATGTLIISMIGSFTGSVNNYVFLDNANTFVDVPYNYSSVTNKIYAKLELNQAYNLYLRLFPFNSNKGYQMYRTDYTINDVNGNEGIVTNFVTGGTQNTGTLLTIPFTATTISNAYNFEYNVTLYANYLTPTPTPIPTMTPSPTPVPTYTPTPSPTPTSTPTATPLGPTATPTSTPTITPTPTPVPLPTGSLFYYDPGNIASYPGSGSILYDLSGNGRHANINTGITWVSGSAAYFDLNGNDNNSITGATLSQTLTSWSMWIGIYRNTQGDYDGFMTERSAANNVNGLGAFSTTNRLSVLVNNGTELTEPTGRMVTDNWMFLGGAVDNTTLTSMVYKAGNLDTFVTGSKAAGSSNFNDPIVLGEDKEASVDRTMNGRIGPALMYDRKLSTTELTVINDYFKSRYGI